MMYDPLPFTSLIDSTTPDRTPAVWVPKVVNVDEKPFSASIPDGAINYVGRPEDSGPAALPEWPIVYSHAGLDFSAPIPLRHNHQLAVVGEIEGIWADGPRLMARGLTYRTTPLSSFIAESSAAGFAWRASTNVRLARMCIRHVQAGELATVNGLSLFGPLLVVDRWRIDEVSVGLDTVDRSTWFRVEPGADYTPRWEEVAGILVLPTGLVADDSLPTFTDDLSREWTVAIDFEGAELIEHACEVSARHLAIDRVYQAAVLADQDLVGNVLYCSSFDPSGRRAAITLEEFRAGLQNDWTITDASGALLDALARYVGRPARHPSLTLNARKDIDS